ncbi:MAG: TRAP transporter large permease subunit [Spirochaetales bacterium]|nr:TRAP transporter large permease subunit [Spirochaetales bacterium]
MQPLQSDRRAIRGALRFENGLSGLVLLLIALLPAMEIIARLFFKTGIHSSADLTHHLVLWLTCLGGAITSREGKHITLSAGLEMIGSSVRLWIVTATTFISTTISTAMTWSALSLVLIGFDPSKRIGFIPVQIAAAVIPLGFLLITVRFLARSPIRGWKRALAALGCLLGTIIAFSSVMNVLYTVFPQVPLFLDGLQMLFQQIAERISLAGLVIVILSIFFGTPIFIVLGGVAYLLFVRSFGALEVIPSEAYSMLTGYSIPAIPLFTFAGFILSESKAGERLVRLFRAWLGWLPGGLIIMAVLVCTFFTTFTGATGVTILALGALLAYVLVESGRYSTDFANGLITGSGSIGLLFPPSLPIILYGVIAQINIKHMFVGGILPGLLMVLTICGIGVFTAVRHKVKPVRFQIREAALSIKDSFWEILLPVIILLGYFGGLFTLVETGAVAVIYALIIEMLIHRDLSLRDLPGVMLKCIPIVGGVLIILAAAKGLSYYLVDAEVPMRLSSWVQANISSRYLFLILLNLALLVTGCLMDIFSAILVVVPLIIPMGEIFGVHPVHLGVIFLANLGVGYLTPPVGLNLFLAAYRFEQPLVRIYRNVIPFFLALLAVVLLITYVPWFSVGLLRWEFLIRLFNL